MASMESAERAVKRQKVDGEKQLMGDIPSDTFPTFIDLYDGPKVTIVVQDRKYELPKRLLCHHSPFFDKMLNSTFREGISQEVELQGTSFWAFELVIQWMFTSTFSLPTSYKLDAHIVDLHIFFFVLADYLDLLGPFTTALATVQAIFLKNRNVLESAHIQEVMKLPEHNPMRVLVISACLKPYWDSIKRDRTTHTAIPFKLSEDMSKTDGFASALFKAFDEAARIGAGPGCDLKSRAFVHPMTGRDMSWDGYNSD